MTQKSKEKEHEELVWKYFPGGEWEIIFPGKDYEPTNIVEMHSAPLRGYIRLGDGWGFDFPHLNNLSLETCANIDRTLQEKMSDFEGALVILKLEVKEEILKLQKVLPSIFKMPASKISEFSDSVTEWYTLPAYPEYDKEQDIENYPPSDKVVLVWTPHGPEEGICYRDYRGGHYWCTPEHVSIAEVWAWAFKPKGKQLC